MASRKRSASFAGLDPAGNLPQRPKHEQIGRAKVTQEHTRQGTKYIITVKVTSEPHDEDSEFRRWIEAEFGIRREQGKNKKLGSLKGYIIDMRFKHPGETRPAWLKLLKPPANYAGDLRTHPSENDKLGSLEKVLMLLFDEKGRVRQIVEDHSDGLYRDKIHYLSDFTLKPTYRGRGLSTIVLKAYLLALGQLSDGFDFQGAVILSPGPFTPESEVEAAQDDDELQKNWFAAVDKLRGVYDKAGFQDWLIGDKDLLDAISIMGLVLGLPDPRSWNFIQEWRAEGRKHVGYRNWP